MRSVCKWVIIKLENQTELTIMCSLCPRHRSQRGLPLPGRVSHPGPLWPLLDAPCPDPSASQIARARPQCHRSVHRGHHGGRAPLRRRHHQEDFCHLRQGWARGRGAGRVKGKADSGVSGVQPQGERRGCPRSWQRARGSQPHHLPGAPEEPAVQTVLCLQHT